MRLALDIGGTLVKCAAVNDAGEIVESDEFTTDPMLETSEFGSYLVSETAKLVKAWGMEPDLVGAGMAGFTDSRKGIVYRSPNIPNIVNFELARVLSDGLGKPAYIDNDATAAAWGEYLFGGYGEIRDMLVVTLGTGIGGGLVLDGKLYRGAHGMAGEIGQMVYTPDGPECPGGAPGCVEYYAGKQGFVKDYMERAGGRETVEPDVIYQRANEGDPEAIEAWNGYGRKLGVILASSANLLDLGIIVLTGGILGAWDRFEKSLKDSLRKHLIAPHKDRLEVVKTNLGGKAGLLGAAFLDKAVGEKFTGMG